MWVMTCAKNLDRKAAHVRATWAKRFDKVLYASDYENKTFPTIAINPGLGREHLTAKTMQTFDYIYKHHFHDADWFMKADDDTYVIAENLRYFLSGQNTSSPIYFGSHFRTRMPQGYMSGGAGYVISKEALRRYGARASGACAEDYGSEDKFFGFCMEKLGVKTGESRDVLNRTRFHCFTPGNHVHGKYVDWYYKFDKYGGQEVSYHGNRDAFSHNL